MTDERRTLAIDFDGVIHRYSRGWADGTIYDPPVAGAIPALWALRAAGYRIVIFTGRLREEGQHHHVEQWLTQHGAPPCTVTNIKPRALAYIDDRAVRFTNWPDIRKRFV